MHAFASHIPGPGGRLWVQRWDPVSAAVAPADEAPSRTPLVLLHDSLGCVQLWRDFPAQLAQATGRSVVAYDRLGFGQSDACAHDLAPDFVATEATGGLAAVRAALGLEQVLLLGHSVGGGMAVCAAAQLGAACQGLVTIAAQAFVEDRTREGIRTAQAGFAQPGALERLARYHGDKAAWVLNAWTATWLSPAFADWSLQAWLPQLACPLLAIHGEADEYGSLAHPRQIVAGCAGQATALVLPGCGHVPQRERTAEVLQAVADHLAPLP